MKISWQRQKKKKKRKIEEKQFSGWGGGVGGGVNRTMRNHLSLKHYTATVTRTKCIRLRKKTEIKRKRRGNRTETFFFLLSDESPKKCTLKMSLKNDDDIRLKTYSIGKGKMCLSQSLLLIYKKKKKTNKPKFNEFSEKKSTPSSPFQKKKTEL